jgi:hypothetical protein
MSGENRAKLNADLGELEPALRARDDFSGVIPRIAANKRATPTRCAG